MSSLLRPTVRHQGCIHRTGRLAGDRVNPQPGLLDQSIEHAPGERAIRTAALQSEVHQNRFSRCYLHRQALRSEMKRHLIQDQATMLRLDPSYDRRSSANRLPPVAVPRR